MRHVTQSYLTTVCYVLHSVHWLGDCEWRTETDVEGNGRGPPKVLYDNFPVVTEEDYKRYSEINTPLGLDLNTRPSKLQPYPLTAVFAKECLFKATRQVATAFQQTLYKYIYTKGYAKRHKHVSHLNVRISDPSLTLIVLMWRIGWAHNNARK